MQDELNSLRKHQPWSRQLYDLVYGHKINKKEMKGNKKINSVYFRHFQDLSLLYGKKQVYRLGIPIISCIQLYIIWYINKKVRHLQTPSQVSYTPKSL